MHILQLQISDESKYFLIKTGFEKYDTITLSKNSQNRCIYFCIMYPSNYITINHKICSKKGKIEN